MQQQFQINMQQTRSFGLSQVVWAKVTTYPWWPAQVVQIVEQSHRKLYKVSFFGDPTQQQCLLCSCYLQQQFLLDFNCTFPPSHFSSFELEKPIELAKSTLRKMQTPPTKQTSIVVENHFDLTGPYEPKSIEQNIEKQDAQFQQLTNINTETFFQEITTHNVINILSGSSLRCLELKKGYNNRKNFGQIHDKLKSKLLQKYNLEQVPKPLSCKKMFICKMGKKSQKKKVKQQCGRKLYRILKKREGWRQSRQMVAEKIQSLGNYQEDKKTFRQGYRSMLFLMQGQTPIKEQQTHLIP